MISQELIFFLREQALKNETVDFISVDPIQFPHRYSNDQDIEVSAFISQWIAYGSRKVFIKVLEQIHKVMDSKGGPWNYVNGTDWQEYAESDKVMYRFQKWGDLAVLCSILHDYYRTHASLQDLATDSHAMTFVDNLAGLMLDVPGVPLPGSQSANKRIWMFLRWMVRQNSVVDFGIWHRINQSELLVPVDTHVLQAARKLGLIASNSASLSCAKLLSEQMNQVFPGDAARSDFALFFYETFVL